MKNSLLLLSVVMASVAFAEYPILVSYPGDVGKQGWNIVAEQEGKVVYIPFEGYYESKGGSIEGPKFKFDKKEGESAYYQLTYTSKSKSHGYWWCDFFDKDGNMLPDINSRLYQDSQWKTYTVQFPCDPRAVEGRLKFVSSKGCTVKDVSLRRVSVADAAKWCDDYYKTLPQMKLDIPANPFQFLPKTLDALKTGKKWRVVLLGDSIVNDTYCSCFTALVQRDFPNVEFVISVRGSTGVYYYHDAKNFEEYCGKYNPDLVLIGGISNHAAESYDPIPGNMAETIDRCRAIGAEVVVMTPPPSYEWRLDREHVRWDENFACWAYCSWLKRMQFWTPMWQSYMREITGEKRAALWDMTTAPANAMCYSRAPRNWFKRDGAHNSDRGKQLIGQTLAAYFRKAKTIADGRVFRPAAVPIFVNDPFISIWSRSDTLTSGNTTHWNSWREREDNQNSKSQLSHWVYEPAAFGLKVQIGDRSYRLMGKDPQSIGAMPQVSCTVKPLESVYRFEDDRTELELTFATPFLTDDLDVFSRPLSYVYVRTRQKDGVARAVTLALSASGEVVSNNSQEPVESDQTSFNGGTAVRMRRVNPVIMDNSMRANWGTLWLVVPGEGIASPNAIATPAGEQSVAIAWKQPSAVEGSSFAAVAMEYGENAGTFLGAKIRGWWARNGMSFTEMLGKALAEAGSLKKRMEKFDADFVADLKRVGGDKYADIASTVYRQSYGACKLFASPKGEPMFCSKENGSGNMISTTDVFYPQFPHMLLTSLPLAKATLRPTMEYASSGKWPYDYAPHDLGVYPRMEKQWYAMGEWFWDRKCDDSCRMPVEECGNMLICLASIATAEGNADFAAKWWPTVTKWAEYLSKFGFDPADQLCTDDFAGHLSHNANLSIKAIMGLASYAKMAEMKGDQATAKKYWQLAKDAVPKWMEAAKGGAEGSYRLAFDRPGTWSMKYNLVWDRLLGYNLFPTSIAKAELRAYRLLQNKYGLPLDSRSTWSKSDWLVWSATLTGDKDDFNALINPLWDFATATPDRIPFADWYYTDFGGVTNLKGGKLLHVISFSARSVVGGFFMPMLYDREAVAKWRVK